MKRKMYANFNELVFEDRNRFYGAYVLRKQYEDNLLVGLLFGLFVVGAIVSIPYIQNLFKDKTEEFTVIPLDKPDIITIDNDVPEEVLPPLKENVEPAQPDAATKTFTEFKLTSEPNSNITTIDELDGVMPGTTDNEGEINWTSTTTTTNNDKLIDENSGTKTYDFVRIETKPQYPGGDEAMYDFLGSSLQYPESAKRVGIEGTVSLEFIIDELGAIRDVKVLRGIGGGCDEEAVRVVKSMKRWKPGRQGGHAVRVRYTIPIQFNLN